MNGLLRIKNLLFLTLALFLVTAKAGSVEQVDEGLYHGYLKSRPSLEFRMERLSGANHSKWVAFIQEQLTGRTEILGEGALHFRKVLSEVSYKDNEIWVASLYDTKNSNIVMYVTVTSSPDALITSHMGIAKTKEAFQKE